MTHGTLPTVEVEIATQRKSIHIAGGSPSALSLHPGVTSAGIETESQGEVN
jgi:hypothetical protein